jgi:hypothetical protein
LVGVRVRVGEGVNVGVIVGEAVAVGESVAVAVGVTVGVGVIVGVAVAVGVLVFVGDGDGLGVDDGASVGLGVTGVGVAVAVGVAVMLGVDEGARVALGPVVFVAVGVGVSVAVGVSVSVGVSVGGPPATVPPAMVMTCPFVSNATSLSSGGKAPNATSTWPLTSYRMAFAAPELAAAIASTSVQSPVSPLDPPEQRPSLERDRLLTAAADVLVSGPRPASPAETTASAPRARHAMPRATCRRAESVGLDVMFLT